ncbi:Cobalamin biosynthesis protein CobD [bacterium HR19]|nr:Cobalamin biosynthesis protein CobD [bacterium HR19]
MNYKEIFVFLGALIFDILLGEPHIKIHPVYITGKILEKIEKIATDKKNGQKKESRIQKTFELLFGAILIAAGILIYLSLYLVSKKIAQKIWELADIKVFEIFVDIFFLKTTFSIKSLKDHAQDVLNSLKKNDIKKARENTSKIVSRNTKELEKPHIISATIESVSENLVDSVIAPLLFFLLAGIEGAIIYRVINTLDAMVGYKNEKYKYIGFIPAKIDDILNFIPARISALIIIFSAILKKYDWKSGVENLKKFKKSTPSPNSWIPITLFGGILKIKLEKIGYYSIGEFELPQSEEKIEEAIKLMMTSSLVFIFFFIVPILLVLESIK